MTRFQFLSVPILLLLAGLATAQVTPNVPTSQLFGSSWNSVSPTGSPPQPNPWCPQDSSGAVVKLTSFRVWDDGIKWNQVETSRGTYNWTKMDYIVNTLAINAGCPQIVMYQFGSTPPWATAIPNATDPGPLLPGKTNEPTGCTPGVSCFGGGTQCASPGDFSCLPPADIDSGTCNNTVTTGCGLGPDTIFQEFVYTLFQRYGTKIGQFGLGNEWDSPNFWCNTNLVTVCAGSTASQKRAVRMGWDARNIAKCFNPSVKIISWDGHVGTMPTWFHQMMGTTISAPAGSIKIGAGPTCSWGAQSVNGAMDIDVVDEHMRGTSSTNNDPTAVIAAYNAAVSEMTNDGLLALPLFNDEYGYNGTAQAGNVQIQAGYAAVQLALMASFSSPNITQSNWYQWDANQGPLSQTIAGLGYNTMKGWLQGSTVNNFTNVGSVYSITGNTSGGGSFKIMFDNSKTCTTSTQSSCTTSNQSAGAFTKYTDVLGVQHNVSGGQAPVGWQPILLTGGSSTVAASPTCSPVAGTYTTGQSVTCSSTSPGSVLCYNFTGAPATNGMTACAAGSTKYTGALAIAINETLFIVAGGTGFVDSSIANYAYVFQGAAPTFSPVAGSYGSTQSVTISQAQSLAICFTTDGSTPTSNGSGTCSHGTLYSAPVSVATSETLKAIGMANNWTDSAVGAASYVIASATMAAAPTCSPAGGTFAATQNPTCSTTSAGAVQCWTLDGSTPITNGASGCTHGTLYSGAIPVTVNSTLMIVAGGTTYIDSLVSSFAFVFHGSAPTFSPAAGTYSSPQTVTLTDPQSLAMCFTTDGTNPTSNGAGACTNGTLYSTAISVSTTKTIKAIGIKNGWNDSTGGTAAYTITGGLIAATPTFSPVAGTYTATQSVALSTTSSGAIICYNFTGSPQTSGTTGCVTGTLYTAPISVALNETIFAVAGGTGYTDSSVGSAGYVFQGAASTFSPVAGTYNSAQTVTISQAQSLSICYTTDGSAPTSDGAGNCVNGTLYSVPLVIASTETLKAIGIKNGWTDSTVGSAAYTINYTLTVTVTGLGIVNSAPVGINTCTASSGECSSLFPQGTVVTLTATPGSGYSFSGWSGGGCSGTSTCVVTMNSATSVTATFTIIVPQQSTGGPVGVMLN
jgi:hypothetical protein